MKFDRVLNINDNETSRYALTRMLEHAGFEVIEAVTGQQGLELAQERQPDVVLLDIKLPDIDGIEVCRRLKSAEATSRVPVLHITAHLLGVEKKVQSLENGADAYLTFPVDRTYLVAIVRSQIRLSRLERERQSVLETMKTQNERLMEALDELRTEKSFKEKFVATLSHDLRNPLAAIKLAAEVGKRGIARPELIATQFERIVQTVDRADGMIQDLLDANQLRAGQRLPIKPREMDLRKLVQETVEEFSARFKNPITVNAPTGLAGAWDGSALRRVIENLLQNAIKYGAPQGVVTISLLDQGERARMTIHNWGQPIADEDMRWLFDPYRRSESARNGLAGGWGLGLTLVQGVVEAHGGTVRVESSVDRGTAFITEFPKTREASPRLTMVPNTTEEKEDRTHDSRSKSSAS